MVRGGFVEGKLVDAEGMQRQALPLLRPEISYVGTGLEGVIAKDSGLAVVSIADGEVTYMDSATIAVKEGKETRTYHLQKFDRSNQGTCINQTPIVKVGDKIKAGQVIADGPAMVFHKYDMADPTSTVFAPSKTSAILDKIKDQGFKYSTVAAITVAISDINAITNKVEIVEKGQKEVDKVEKIFHKGMTCHLLIIGLRVNFYKCRRVRNIRGFPNLKGIIF